MGNRRKRLITWAREDEDDERFINYTFRALDGEVMHFTSENEVTPHMMRRLQNSWIEKVELTPENTWDIVIYEE